MKLGIMQPYFFPYIGYWQLIDFVDKYVIYDDVNFIKGGWINRNRILMQNQPKYIHVQMRGASSNKRINQILVDENVLWKQKTLKTLENCYRKSPCFSEIKELVAEIILHDEKNLAKYLENSIRKLCCYLDIHTEIVLSSEIDKDNELKGEAKILDICRRMGADTYINAIGGKDLYSSENFRKNGVELLFLETSDVKYLQYDEKFIENLSIIDILMFNTKEQVKEMLGQYTLVNN